MSRVILDEGVPRTLARRLREHGIDAVPFPNDWKQLSNGALLAEVVQQGFGVLITNDKQMQFQQNLTNLTLAVLVLPTNRRPDVLALASEIADAVRSARMGQVLSIGASHVQPSKGGR